MPILVTCKCGKKFRADEKHAGKQKPCPKCGQPLDIAGPHVSAYDVFVSYSSKDKTTCDALVATFERKGMRCWIAPRDILPGVNWGEAIIGGIEQCRAMVLVFSAHSNESPQVKREVERAVSKGIPVIPLRIEDVKLSRAMEYFISSQHWLDALTPPLEDHLEELARKVARLLSDDGSSAAAPGRSGPEPIPKAIPVGEWSPPGPESFSPQHSSNEGSWPTTSMANEPSSLRATYLLPRAARQSMLTRIPLVWRWVAVASAAALIVLLIFSFLRPSGVGAIKIDIPSSYANLTVKIDGETINASQLSNPLRLKVGDHRLEVTGKDIEPENKSFPVVEGENPALEVNFVLAPPAPKSTPAVVKSQAAESVPNKSEKAPTPANPDAGKTATELVSPTILPSVEPSTAVVSEPAWTDLFNGRDLTGWTAPVLPKNWEVHDGLIVAKGSGLSALFANEIYDDFELELEYKLTPGSNSGIYVRAPNNTDARFNGAKDVMSISLLDDASPVWANDIKNPSKRTGGLHAVAGPNPLPTAPAGAWNRLLLRAVGPTITVAINGVQVLDVNTAEHVARLPEYTGLTRTSGYVGLEDHGEDGVAFRNIRIRDLSSGGD